jgi:hypothetical protein
MNMEYWILFAGLLHGVVLGASALIPRLLNWRSALACLPPFYRSLFWVYGAFIVLVIVGLGALLVLCNEELASGTPLARGFLGLAACFWTARLAVQFWVFDPGPLLRNRWMRAGYHGLTVLFTLLALICGTAALRP